MTPSTPACYNHMVNNIRKIILQIIIMAAVFLAAAGAMAGLLTLSAMIPRERIHENSLRSAEYLCSGEQFATVIEDVEASRLERLTDSMGIYSLKGYVCPAFIIISRTPEANATLFKKIYDAMPVESGDVEPMMNILSWMLFSSVDGVSMIVSVVIPRTKHRPDCYFKQGDDQIMVSPGALDMAGLIVTPREKDFRRMTSQLATDIIKECAYTLDDELEVILAAKGGVK